MFLSVLVISESTINLNITLFFMLIVISSCSDFGSALLLWFVWVHVLIRSYWRVKSFLPNKWVKRRWKRRGWNKRDWNIWIKPWNCSCFDNTITLKSNILLYSFIHLIQFSLSEKKVEPTECCCQHLSSSSLFIPLSSQSFQMWKERKKWKKEKTELSFPWNACNSQFQSITRGQYIKSWILSFLFNISSFHIFLSFTLETLNIFYLSLHRQRAIVILVNLIRFQTVHLFLVDILLYSLDLFPLVSTFFNLTITTTTVWRMHIKRLTFQPFLFCVFSCFATQNVKAYHIFIVHYW